MTKRIEIVIPETDLEAKMAGEKQVRADVRGAGKAVLMALEKWGMLSQSQVESLLFGRGMDQEKRVNLFFNDAFDGKYDAPGYKVLRRLKGAGLVRLHGFPNATFYTLTGRGHAFMLQRRIARLPGLRLSTSASMVSHELLVNGIGLTISSTLGYPVSTEFERYIRSRHAKPGAATTGLLLPDLWISDGSAPKAVEVERTLKEAGRYQKLWMAYRGALPREAVVLYITAWPNGAQAILSRARKFLMDFIYVCEFEDFRKSLGTAPFVGYRGGQVRLEKRSDRPQGTHPQRAPMASLPARQDVSVGGRLPIVPFASPPQSMRIGEPSLPLARQGRSVSPLETRPFPRPHPLAPSPSPEGEQRVTRGNLRSGDFFR